jgi:DNA-binding beta-propeller fold protein YncE
MEVKFINNNPSKYSTVSSAILEWFEEALKSAPITYRYYKDEFLVAVPLYFLRLIAAEQFNRQGSPYTGVIQRFEGWTIVPGYEDAVVFFNPNHSYDERMVYKVPFSESNTFSIKKNETNLINEG